MTTLWLFIVSCILGGLGGAVGSMIGHAFGPHALWAGGVAGGLLGALLAARVAAWRRWITAEQYWPTAAGAAVGFLAAAALAVRTLSTPVGPVLSTTLVGLGAVIGSKVWRSRSRTAPPDTDPRPRSL